MSSKLSFFQQVQEYRARLRFKHSQRRRRTVLWLKLSFAKSSSFVCFYNITYAILLGEFRNILICFQNLTKNVFIIWRYIKFFIKVHAQSKANFAEGSISITILIIVLFLPVLFFYIVTLQNISALFKLLRRFISFYLPYHTITYLHPIALSLSHTPQ